MTLFASQPGPLWWRLPVWTGLTVFAVYTAHGTDSRVATGVLMTGSWIALQFLDGGDAPRQRLLVVASTVLGLAACFPSRNGVAAVVVCVAIARAPNALKGLSLQVYTVAMAVAFGVTIALISDSLFGLLAGTAAPALVQRTLEHFELVRERDRARALLAEAQVGREAATQAAALQERGRIAREMHDVLAHTLAGLSLQLQAVRAVAARDGASAAVLEPLDKAATLARDGLTEARTAVGTLRDPVGLGLPELAALVDRHPGRAVLTSTGDAGTVTAEAGHAIYRTVQEGLTNAARYAPGTSATVTLAWHPDELEVTVRDTGPAPGRGAVDGPSTGLGLAGMAERIAHVGGRVQAGPDGPGWLIRAVVPVQTVAAS